MFYYWNCLLLLVSGLVLPFAGNPQPRFLATVLLLTAILGLALLQYHLWTVPEAWYMLSAVYFLMNLAVIAMSPAQILLLFFMEPTEKPVPGISELYRCSKEDEIVADIVAVHGLGSNPKWAWNYDLGEGKTCMWLKDLLPEDLPNTRIMAFNHNSKWDIDASVKSIEARGQELLDNLKRCRQSPKEEERKIIFVGHSFGGIIIKQALVLASRSTLDDDRYKPLKDSTASIIFLGVPHDGSRLTPAGKLMAYATYWLGSSTALLELLEPRSDVLHKLNDSFLSVFEMKKLVNFYERHKTKKWGIPLLLAVDEKSGSLSGATNIVLEADHVGMNKFKSSEDNNYKYVLCEMATAVKGLRGYSEADSQALLRSLAFKGMNNRIHVIAENHKETLNWIWSEDSFLRWKEKNSGVFWVTGKPGSGKSTLLKHVFNEQKKDSSAVFAGFFFNDRGGGGLVNSFKGFLQAILHQILSQMPVPSIYRCLIPLYKKQLEEEKSQEGFEWPIPTLRKCLLEILGGTTESPIYIFIDALDECEVNPRERLSDEYSMLAFLEDICRFRHSNDHELRIFVTSRYDGRINTMMERINGAGKGYLGSIRLEKLSGKDMETYVSDQVLTLKLPERFQEVVREELLSRAQGVFLWVRLVIYDLRGCAQYLDSADEIKKVLDSIPDELDDLYSRLLMKVGSNLLHKTETMLRWVLFAKRPLTLEEFGYAIAIRSFERQFSSIEDIEAWIPPSQSQETIKSTIQTLSGGLLEIVSRHENQGGGSLVQLIHQSAREFLISRPRMVSGVEMRLAKSISNAHITDVCISYLKLSRPCQQSNDKHRGIDSFISYAGQHWPAHLHDASSSGYLSTYSDAESKEEMEMEPKRTFLNAQNFIFSRSASFWISAFQYGRNPVEIAYEEKFHRIIKNGMERKFKFDLPDYDVEVLEGAVALGYEEIVREVLLKSEKDPNVLKPHSDRYWAALYTATIKGYEGIVQLLMQHKANVKAHCGECGNALYDAKIKGLERMTRILIKNGANFHPQPKGTEYRRALYSTKYLRDLSMLRFLVENGADVNPQYRIYRNRTSISKSHNIPPQEHLSSPQMELSVLQNAIWENSTVDAVKILIDGGADINAPDGILGNALTIAVKKLNLEIVQLLVENGVNIDAQGGEYGNALQAASTKGMEIVKYLVENGANIKVKGGKYGGALQAAAYHQNWDVVRFLVQNGADINASGPYGSILQIAAYRNDKKTFEFLMKNGVDINAQGSGYGNALQAAATGSLNIVEVLYKAGLDVNTQGGYYGNALQAAAHRGDESIFLFLIDKKANVHAQGGRYGTALQAAAQRGRSRIVDLLIHKLNVDVNVQGGFYHTALQAACAAVRDRGVVDLLVHKGAEVNARGGKYNTALQAAALRNLANVELLIENGADVNAQGGYFGNALQAAATRNLGTVEFLILNGADVNAQGGHHGNALQAAKANGKSSIVRLLLQHGAKWGTENSDASIATYIPATPIQAEDRARSCSSEPLDHVSSINS